MEKVGMYGGNFNPLHLGHVNDLIAASCMCEKLYVILSHSNNPLEIPHQERFMWLKEITKDLDNVEVLEVFDDSYNKEKYDWKKGANDIKALINKPIDIVFAGDDYQGKNIWETLYPESNIHYFNRDEINISSTEIRSNPFKYYDYLPSCVRRYYNKKVVIVGTESCGKSTLVRNLSKIYCNIFSKLFEKDIITLTEEIAWDWNEAMDSALEAEEEKNIQKQAEKEISHHFDS